MIPESSCACSWCGSISLASIAPDIGCLQIGGELSQARNHIAVITMYGGAVRSLSARHGNLRLLNEVWYGSQFCVCFLARQQVL